MLLWSGNEIYRHVPCPLMAALARVFAEFHVPLTAQCGGVSGAAYTGLWYGHDETQCRRKGRQAVPILGVYQTTKATRCGFWYGWF